MQLASIRGALMPKVMQDSQRTSGVGGLTTVIIIVYIITMKRASCVIRDN